MIGFIDLIIAAIAFVLSFGWSGLLIGIAVCAVYYGILRLFTEKKKPLE